MTAKLYIKENFTEALLCKGLHKMHYVKSYIM